MKLKQNHRKISHRILKVSEIAFILFPFQLFGLCHSAVEDALQVLRDLSVLPGLGGANLLLAGVTETLDESVHVLVITELYEELRDVLGRPNAVAFMEKNHVVDVGCVKEDRTKRQAAFTHLATANHKVAALAVLFHMNFGDAAVVELAGFEPPVPPLHGGLILLDVKEMRM